MELRPAGQRPGVLAAVAAGGLVGAAARYELGAAVTSPPGRFPVATFVINVSGSLILGALLTLVMERWPPTEYVRPFFATGFLGAYTTWSTFMVEADTLLGDGHVGVAAAYLAATMAAGLGAAYLGVLAARARPRRRIGRLP